MEKRERMECSFSLSLLLAFSLLRLCRASDTLLANQSLSGTQTLVSAGGKFELGFFSPNTSSAAGGGGGNASRHYIGIWFKTVPTQTVVWVANRDAPVPDPSTSRLTFSPDGRLVVLDPSGASVWSSSSSGASLASLLDTGNLVLQPNSTPAGAAAPLWQSFYYPTDTWMPGGVMGVDKVTGEYQRITSWKDPGDPATGPYAQSMDPDGTDQYVLLYNASDIYWSSGLWNGQYFSAVPGTQESTVFNFTFVDGPRRKFAVYTINDPDLISRYVIEPNGQSREWFWMKDSQVWSPVFTQPLTQCDVYFVCGSFGVCGSGASACNCPDGFQPTVNREWTSGDWSSGCSRKTQLQCNNNDGFLELPMVQLPSDPQTQPGVASKNECENSCRSNCSCLAYSYDDTGCSVWKKDIRNLQQLQAGDSNAATLFLRLAASDIPASGHSRRWVIILVPCLVAAIILVSFAIAALIWIRRRRGGKKVEGNLVSYNYSDLQSITKNFSVKLGSGGFGSVYKGTLPDSTAVAVKKLEGLNQGEKQFRAEVSTLGAIQHVNLVHLRGFCCKGSNRLLVYDYMPRGSLDTLLSDGGDDSMVLDWKKRFLVALGIAKGLAYLHEGCRECIIHCDIKPDNILLDDDFCPKVADFGMSKLIGHDFSKVLTTMRGTVGYLAPEWISGLPITPRVDAYSYGMMLFELVSGRRNMHHNKGEQAKGFFPSWAASKVIEGDVLPLLDHRLHGDADAVELERVCRVACWCIQDSDSHRPTMGQVVQMLEGIGEVKVPPMPAALQNLIGDDQLIFYNMSSREGDQTSDTSQSSRERTRYTTDTSDR